MLPGVCPGVWMTRSEVWPTAISSPSARRRSGAGELLGPEEQAELDVVGDLEHAGVGGVHGQRNGVLLDDIAVGADVVDVTVGVEDDDGLELEVGDGRDDLLGVGAGVDDGAGARLFAVDEVAVRLEGADHHQLVLHNPIPEAILMPSPGIVKNTRPRV